ncbi:DUF4383 domain-containing protein [Kitasatospora sp. NA04385]|uniref:DUF4383 domain-containing protein n=1 Tax=Kitasatospora sp. NA04385 TaxID=2742135 RepID=UPI0015926FEC|nr:DUF4383 domain-containing protein [Kitasatospora sp. NA04385]QKW18059.1 DUF4383 domain-containing protein [Kitasatospora sp. NA04385]
MEPQHRPSADRRLSRIHRLGAALCALLLLAFGALGLADGLPFFGTHGERVAGLSSNGLLSTVSIATAAVLLAAALRGGRQASSTAIAVGALFVLSGFVNLALLDSSANLLAFRIPNVLFSFAMGLLLAALGMYGRVSGGLPHDNPYWLRRHPQAVPAATTRAVAAGLSGASALPGAVGPSGATAVRPGNPG